MQSKPDIFIEFTLTNNCNCNCKYCFENKSGGKLTSRNPEEENRQLRLLGATCEKFDVTRYGWLTISFWGGEPMLNLEFMEKLIRATYKYSFVRYHLYTNGTLTEKFKELLSKDFIREIKDRIHIQLSYDGEPHHTLMRGDNSKNIFDTADALLDAGVRFNFKATLSFDLIKELPRIWKSYESLYYKYGNFVRYSPTLDTTYKSADKITVWTEQLAVISEFESGFIRRNGHPLWDWFSPIDRKANCMLGNSMHVHNTGDIFICHGCAYINENEKLKLGKTREIQSFFDVINTDYQINVIPVKCKQCIATHCQICHVEEIDKTRPPGEQWVSCRVNNKNRCLYFKIFGFMAKYLRYRLKFGDLTYGN